MDLQRVAQVIAIAKTMALNRSVLRDGRCIGANRVDMRSWQADTERELSSPRNMQHFGQPKEIRQQTLQAAALCRVTVGW
jgi:hypothetical protein